MIVLGIETSCDETAISVVKAEGDLSSLSFNLLGSAVNSQIEAHREFGGVVPMLAKREHLKNLPLVLNEALKKAGLISDLEFSIFNSKNPGIDTITVTVGPGLEPALWTGIKFAEKLGISWGIPVIGTNHMIGHIASVLFKKDEFESKKAQVEFPALALLVSGGHTELILIKSWQDMEKIGETKDDAVGEAFDKVARMLGLPYPGGPEISRLASKARESGVINKELRLPRPMIHSKDFNFSFSGLKTAVLYHIRGIEEVTEKNRLEIAREFEDAVTDTLISKTKKALNKYLPKTLIVGGGVIANNYLKENILNLKADYPELEIFIPEKSLTTDNATMITAAGYIEYLKRGTDKDQLRANGNLKI